MALRFVDFLDRAVGQEQGDPDQPPHGQEERKQEESCDHF
jgi:hypothetical protein